MSEKSKVELETWALVELLGRQRIVGKVSEATIAGGSFIRIDVPEQDGQAAFTRFYGPGSIYCISPVTDEVGLELLKTCRNEPVSRYDVPRLAEKYSRPYDPEASED